MTLLRATALALLPHLLVAQAAPAGPHEVTSAWTLLRDGKGAAVGHTVTNRKLDLGSGFIDGHSRAVLYVEEFREVYHYGAAATNDTVVVEAWADVGQNHTYALRLWRFSSPGSKVRRVGEYYDVLVGGCCGTENGHNYFSLRSGRMIFSSTHEPIELVGYDSVGAKDQFHRVVGYLNTNSAVDSKLLRDTKNAEGELVLVEGDSVLSRVVIARTDSSGDHPPGEDLTIVTSFGTKSTSHILLGRNETAVVRVDLSESASIIIPIQKNRFVLSADIWPPYFAKIAR
jgi:hypothetical protein